MTDNSLDRYLELVEKVDDFSRKVARAFGGDIACRNGCDECCGKTFTVFQVEARNLSAGFGLLEPELRRRITERCKCFDPSSPSCVLLDAGSCMLYGHRPIICRTHGLPLVSGNLTINGKSRYTLCDKNFTEPGSLSRLPLEFILNLDTLNTVLSAVNMLYIKELSVDRNLRETSERAWLPDVFKEWR